MKSEQLPWLSVVMPIHNGARDLDATLASVAAERPEGVEFLIYDSSKDDACGTIVARYADRLDIRYAAMADVEGWPQKTNLAVCDARARHIAMLHQDDLWLPGHVRSVRDSISADPHAAMHIAPSRFINVHGRDIGQWSPPFETGACPGQDFGRRLIVQNSIAIPSPIIRRDLWLAVQGLDPTLWYTADWDLYLKLATLGHIQVRRQATTAFRIHGTSLTMTGSRDAPALRKQFDLVLGRHGANFGLDGDLRLRARVMTSVDINCVLAAAAAGKKRSLLLALRRFLCLGPANALRYIYESRIVDRVLPRLRARLEGSL